MFVVGDAAKLPAVLKALKKFKGKLLGLAYWGTADPQVIKVSIINVCCMRCMHNITVGCLTGHVVKHAAPVKHHPTHIHTHKC